MPIQNWSDDVYLVELSDDPQFTDDITAVIEASESAARDVVLDFKNVTFLNASNLAKLLKLRKLLTNNHKKLKLCCVSTHVWGVFLVTGLDKVFEVYDNVSLGLTSLQIGE